MRAIFSLLAVLLFCLGASAALADPLIKYTPPQEVTFEGRLTVPTDSRYVDFGEVKVSDWGDVAPFLAQLPDLEKCDMFASRISAANAEALHAAFPEVEFGWTLYIGSEGCMHECRTDQTAFSTLHAASIKGHPTSELCVLRFCKDLLALDVGHNLMDDITWISELPQLKILIIAINKVEDITPLTGLTDLEYLELFNNYITDITPLAGMTKLLDLNLTYNQIEDFSPLYGLRQLERLWICKAHDRHSHDGIPNDEYLRLKTELPATRIDNWSEPTDGGWRKHIRYYDILYYIFTDVNPSYRPWRSR